MSVKLMSIVFDLPLKPKHKLIMLCLANYANDEGENVYPSLSTIQLKTSLSRPAVTTAMRDLMQDKIIVLESRGSTKRTSSHYHINPAILDEIFTSKADLLVKPLYQSLVKNLLLTSKAALLNPLMIQQLYDPLLGEKKKSPKKPSPEPESHKETCPKEWVDTICGIVKLDQGTATIQARSNVSACGKALIAGHATLGQLDTFEKNWYAFDWRGKQGQTPTVKQLRDEWGKYYQPMNGNGANNGKVKKSVEYTAEEIERANRINAARHAREASLSKVQ